MFRSWATSTSCVGGAEPGGTSGRTGGGVAGAAGGISRMTAAGDVADGGSTVVDDELRDRFDNQLNINSLPVPTTTPTAPAERTGGMLTRRASNLIRGILK
jgi:hypothetical protein